MLDQGFSFKRSQQYLALLCIFSIATFTIVLFVPMTWYLKIPISVIVLLYVGHIIWRYGLLLSGHAIVSIRHLAEGEWIVQTKADTFKALVCGDSVVTNFLSILRFRIAGKFWPQAIIVFPDSLEEGQYRCLLVLLKVSSK